MFNLCTLIVILCPNSCFVSIHSGARPRHLARPEVLVQVRARRLREHEVARGVVGAHPPFWTRASAMSGAQLVSAITQDTRHTATCCSVSALWFCPSSQVGRWPRLRPAWCVFPRPPSPICRGDAANLCWSQRSSLILDVSSFFVCRVTPLLVLFFNTVTPLLVRSVVE